jgi:hypothetical protein
MNIKKPENIKKERDVWFKRTVLWGSIPIHWKGTATIVVTLSFAFPAIFTALSIHNTHHVLAMVCVIIFVSVIISGMIVAELHMSK